jgi:UDP-N-acetylmuramoyl-tripeptide--D-alanyl-D-alanine ligase
MNKMHIDVLEDGTRGKIKHKKNSDFAGITTDSRKDVQDKIFFALKGEVHDGHDFVEAAVKNGVGAVVYHTWNPAWKPLLKSTTWIEVDDTLKALQNLARFWRKKWGKKIIGVTGSNGKTSVKDFAHTLISGGKKVLKNQGSFNNHWGLPLTLLELNDQYEIAIVEMGMNHAGEIKALCQIAEPDIAVVNNVGRAHSENFASLDAIAKAKEEIYFGLKEDGVGVFNLADPQTAKMLEEWREEMARIVTFGTPEADVYFALKDWQKNGLTISGKISGMENTVTVPLWGEQNVLNLMDAAALAVAADVSPQIIWKQLPECRTGWGRNQWVDLKSGASLLFDAYNANPDSFAALFKNLAKMPTKPARMIGVFGEMLEQGDVRDIVHMELGKLAAESCLTDVFFIGKSGAQFQRGFEAVKSSKSLAISDSYEESLALKIKSMLDTNSLVAVKGSRGGALERVVLGLDPLNFTTK